MADNTSPRSAFWLTEKLGLTSHPTRSFLRGENETVKQPSPSTYPEMYEEMSISLAGVLAASTLVMSYTTTFSIATLGVKPQSIRGQFLTRNDFPRYHPRATARRRSGSTDISRYGLAFHLPDKEFRYLRTVIVTAAVYRGFSSSLAALPLTFRHRAGVSPYTSPYGFAETCVFSKQSVGPLSCNPQLLRR